MPLLLRGLRRRSCSLAVSLLACTVVITGSPARADTPSETRAAELPVVIEVAGKALDASAIRDAIAGELGVSVTTDASQAERGALRVRVSANRRADLEFGTSKRAVRRSIDLPADDARAVETIALLAGNLVRDEAAELVAELRQRERDRKAAAAASAEGSAGSSSTAGTPAGPAGSSGAGGPSSTGSPASSGGPTANGDAPAQGPKRPGEPSTAAAAQREPKRSDTGANATPPSGTVELEDSFFNASLFHPVAVHSDSEKRRFKLELGLVYGRIGALSGASATVFVSAVDHGFRGVQLTGLAAYSGADSEGLSLAGGGTISRGKLQGVEGAGGVNLRLGGPDGDRPFSFTKGARLEGVQIAGGYNHLAGDGQGAQIATASATIGSLEGAQVGVVNYAGKIHGAQVGLVNIGRQSSGAQLGVVNVGGRTDGVSLGVVNAAEEINGVPIGLVSVAKNTRFRAIAFASTRFQTNVGLKTITGHVVNEYSIGADISDGTDDGIAQLAISIGAHVPLGDFFLEPTVGWGHERRFDDRTTGNATNTVLYRAKLGWQVSPAFGVFAGGGLVQAIPESTGSSELEGGEGLLGVQLF